jgi:hypothetical protein
VLPAVSAWWLVPLAGALAFATALPWLASELIPDLFTGLLVLALGLAAFAAGRLSRVERAWLIAFSAFMIATHQSHLLLAMLLLPVLVALQWWLRRGTDRSTIGRPHTGHPHLGHPDIGPDAVPMLAAPLLACIALMVVNFIAFQHASVAPFSNVFSLARVIYDGPGMRALIRECPRAPWRLCPYLDQFPAIADEFLWQPNGPLARAGGAKVVSAEANAIMASALAAEPREELRAVLTNTARQLGQFATGDGLKAWPASVTPWIVRDFPRFETNAYLAARQTNDLLVLPGWLLMLHRVVALAGVAVSCALLPVALHRRHLVGGFLAIVLVALPINAFITGGLSGPHDRYQSRVMWLPPLLAALAIPALLVPAWARRPASCPLAPRPSASEGNDAEGSKDLPDSESSPQSALRKPGQNVQPKPGRNVQCKRRRNVRREQRRNVRRTPTRQSRRNARSPPFLVPVGAPRVAFPIRTPRVAFPMRTPRVLFPIRTPRVLFPIRTQRVLFPIRTPRVLFPTRTPHAVRWFHTAAARAPRPRRRSLAAARIAAERPPRADG